MYIKLVHIIQSVRICICFCVCMIQAVYIWYKLYVCAHVIQAVRVFSSSSRNYSNSSRSKSCSSCTFSCSMCARMAYKLYVCSFVCFLCLCMCVPYFCRVFARTPSHAHIHKWFISFRVPCASKIIGCSRLIKTKRLGQQLLSAKNLQSRPFYFLFI